MNHISKMLVPAAAVVVLAGCGAGTGKYSEPFKDADRGSSIDGPADVGTMPDGFGNFAAKCDGTTRVYTLYHSDGAYGSIAVSPDHPKCAGRS